MTISNLITSALELIWWGIGLFISFTIIICVVTTFFDEAKKIVKYFYGKISKNRNRKLNVSERQRKTEKNGENESL